MVSVHCTTLLGQITIMRTSYFNTDFALPMKLTLLMLRTSVRRSDDILLLFKQWKEPQKVVERSFGMLKTLHKRSMLLSSDYLEASIYTWLKKKHLKCLSTHPLQIPTSRKRHISINSFHHWTSQMNELHMWANAGEMIEASRDLCLLNWAIVSLNVKIGILLIYVRLGTLVLVHSCVYKCQ